MVVIVGFAKLLFPLPTSVVNPFTICFFLVKARLIIDWRRQKHWGYPQPQPAFSNKTVL
jgi:hypothetical protein